MCKETLRETLMNIITDKHDDVIAKFGAIIGQKKKTKTGNGIKNGNKNVPKSRDPSKKADELVNFRFNNNKTSKNNLMMMVLMKTIHG
jgi:hypothetical protein